MGNRLWGATAALTCLALITTQAAGAQDQRRGHGPRQEARPELADLFSSGVRTLDGRGNNVRNPDWGKVGTPYARVALPNYADGLGSMVSGPAPRYVSNRVFNDIAQNLFSENGITHWGFTWGQFLDHTFGLRQPGGENAPIAFDPADPLEQFENEAGVIPFARSLAAAGTGTDSPRDQINTVSSYMDAWNVYGGDPQRLEWLRDGPLDGDPANNGARLLTAAGGYLPGAHARGVAAAPAMDPIGPRLMASPQDAVVAGDIRANENIALTGTHTLFVREHNRIVDALPDRLSEEVKFQIARRVVGAEQQYVTYREFLPSLGVELDPYTGYDRGVNATLSNEFATTGYRAHSMIHGELEPGGPLARYSAEQLEALEVKGVEIEITGDEVAFVVPLNVAFANPGLVPQIGLGPIMAGLAGEAEYKNDEQIDNQLRSVLFQLPGPGVDDPSACLDGDTLPDCFSMVLDLGAIDIERGRDHGMPFYNDLRAAYGLSPKRSFAAITGEDTEEFASSPLVDGADPLDDPDILGFTRLLDGDGNVLAPGSEAADTSAVTGIRRTTLAARLKAMYGDVDRLDAFVGMLAEPHVEDSEFGRLQRAMWKREFESLRDGDRFFYGNDPALRTIQRRYGITYRNTLAEIIAMNTELEAADLPPNVFRQP